MEISEIRRCFIEWCEYFMGLRPGDAAYKFATGGRDPGPKYSSCGDLPHTVLRLMGCVDDWVNFESNLTHYRSGKNINLLVPKPIGACPVARHGDDSSRYYLDPGDIIVSWPEGEPNRAHTCVFDNDTDDGEVFTYDFGQGPMSPALWRNGFSHVESAYKKRRVKDLPIRSWIILGDVDFSVSPVLPTGEAFDLIESGRGHLLF